MKLVEQSVHSLSLSRIKPTLHSQVNPTPTGTQIEFGSAEHALGVLKLRFKLNHLMSLLKTIGSDGDIDVGDDVGDNFEMLVTVFAVLSPTMFLSNILYFLT